MWCVRRDRHREAEKRQAQRDNCSNDTTGDLGVAIRWISDARCEPPNQAVPQRGWHELALEQGASSCRSLWGSALHRGEAERRRRKPRGGNHVGSPTSTTVAPCQLGSAPAIAVRMRWEARRNLDRILLDRGALATNMNLTSLLDDDEVSCFASIVRYEEAVLRGQCR